MTGREVVVAVSTTRQELAHAVAAAVVTCVDGETARERVRRV